MTETSKPVAIAAVAKDEAAYIHEWIHHNLYFGFNSIFIGINRTSDATSLILKKIQKSYPEVHLFDVNWIDLARRPADTINEDIQFIAYAYLLDIIRREYAHIAYCTFLDVDEFWCPSHFEGSIQQWLSEAPYFDTASFHWACQFGDRAAFEKPFMNKNARLRGQIKSIVNLHSSCTLDRIRAHSPFFKEHESMVHINANGQAFTPKQALKAKTVPAEEQKAYILHRMTRSELEYISNLQKGMLETDTPIKINRDGFWYTSDQYALPLNGAQLQKYYQSLDKFILDCNISEEIEMARAAILSDADSILAVKRSILFKHLHHYAQTLHGTHMYDRLMEKVKGYNNFSEDERRCLVACAAKLKKDAPHINTDILKLLTGDPFKVRAEKA